MNLSVLILADFNFYRGYFLFDSVYTLNEPRHEKTVLCTRENKDAYQLCGDRTADQRLCFHYMDSTILLLLKSEISECLLPFRKRKLPRDRVASHQRKTMTTSLRPGESKDVVRA